MSPEFAGQTIAFWAKRLNDMTCPRCKSAGTLYAYARSYGAIVACVLDSCSYEERYVDRT